MRKKEKKQKMKTTKKNNILQGKTIRGRLGAITIVSTLVIIIVLLTVNAINTRRVMVNSESELLMLRAKDNALAMEQWLQEEGSITHALKVSLEQMNTTNKKEIMDFMEKNLAENEDALMYYCCFAYDGGVYPADHSKLDLDPTTRDWWKRAMQENKLIYTAPYTDFATGQMIVSIAEPMTLGGQQTAILADITIDRLIQLTESINDGTSTDTFLVAGDGSVITHPNKDFMPKEEGNTILNEKVNIDLTSDKTEMFKDYDGTDKYVAVGNIASTDWKLGIMEDAGIIRKEIVQNVIITLVLGIILLAGSVFLLLITIGRILLPLDGMKRFIREQVIGEENCKECANEMQEISYLLDEMEERFIATIRQTKEESGVIHTKMKGASEKVSEISGNIMEISASMEETSAHVDSQTENIAQINETCNDVSIAVDKLAKEAKEVAERSGSIVKRVGVVVPELISNKDHTVQIVKESGERLEKALKGAEVIHQIETVSNTIQDIAGETNLLALNASIESARAGEAGKGFAVVADEIKVLSDTTSEEIEKVNELIGQVYQSVKVLEKESNEILQFVNKEVLGDYNKLGELASDYEKDAAYFADVSGNLEVSSEKLSSNIADIVSVVEDISMSQSELSNAVQSVNENLQNINTASESVSTEANNVMESIDSLQETIRTFDV